MTEYEGPTAEQLRSLTNELLKTWDGKKTTTLRAKTLARDVTILGYSLHAHSLAHSYLLLADQGKWQEAYPTLRACYELAISAQWLFATKQGLKATLREGERRRKNLIAALMQTFTGSAYSMQSDYDEAEKASKEYEEAKEVPTLFEGVCRDFDSPFLYMVYRSLSQLSHAGPGIPSLYVMVDHEDNVKGFGLQPFTDKDQRMCLYTLCISLVWAGRATDALGGLRDRRNQLRDAAKFLGLPDHLKLGPTGFKREAKGRWRTNSKAKQK